MQLGRAFGLLCIIIGAIFSYEAYSMLHETGSTLKMFGSGPCFLTLGIAMSIFPGGDITAAQSRNKEKDPKTFITEAPAMHKIIWGVALVVGLFATHFLKG